MAEEAIAAEEAQLVVFSLGREEFAVEVTQVREIMRMEEITRMPKTPAYVEGIINLRGQIIAVIGLADRLNLESAERGAKPSGRQRFSCRSHQDQAKTSLTAPSETKRAASGGCQDDCAEIGALTK